MDKEKLTSNTEVDIKKTKIFSSEIEIIGVNPFVYLPDNVLKNISALTPTLLEAQEGLEQLRWLAYYPIKIGFTDFETLAIDTEEDLEIAKSFVKNHKV